MCATQFGTSSCALERLAQDGRRSLDENSREENWMFDAHLGGMCPAVGCGSLAWSGHGNVW